MMSFSIDSQPEYLSLPLSLAHLRLFAFVLALLVYALFGSPTPEAFGWAELLSGILLVMAAGLTACMSVVSGATTYSWQRSARMLLVYGMVVPLLVGMVNANDPVLMLRDIVPFLFILLPLFFSLRIKENSQKTRLSVVTCAVALVGVIFSARVLYPVAMFHMPVRDPLYLANAPTVLFAALLFLGLSGRALYNKATFVSSFKSLLYAGLAAVPFVAMALITQRANMGMVVMVVGVLILVAFVKRPVRAVLPALVLGAVCIIAYDFMSAMGQDLARKSAVVGLNMRWEEAMAVFDVVSGSITSGLFGQGWGATFESPAVGGEVVNFTHSLVTTYLLKSGLIGVALVLLYLLELGFSLLSLLLRHPVEALALAGPFLIDVLLYASFKSLDFGLILLLIALWADYRSPAS